MTNTQRALIKAYIMDALELQAAKWNGNELVGRAKGEKQWRVAVKADEMEKVYDLARKEMRNAARVGS